MTLNSLVVQGQRARCTTSPGEHLKESYKDLRCPRSRTVLIQPPKALYHGEHLGGTTRLLGSSHGDHLKEAARVQGLSHKERLKEAAQVQGSSHGEHLKGTARVLGSAHGDHLKEVARVQGSSHGERLKEVTQVLGSSQREHLKEAARVQDSSQGSFPSTGLIPWGLSQGEHYSCRVLCCPRSGSSRTSRPRHNIIISGRASQGKHLNLDEYISRVLSLSRGENLKEAA